MSFLFDLKNESFVSQNFNHKMLVLTNALKINMMTTQMNLNRFDFAFDDRTVHPVKRVRIVYE